MSPVPEAWTQIYQRCLAETSCETYSQEQAGVGDRGTQSGSKNPGSKVAVMRPHYQNNGITIFLGDAREVLPKLPHGREGYELLLTDPPYGVNATVTGTRYHEIAGTKIAGDETRAIGDEVLSLAWKNLRPFRHAYVFGPFPLAGFPHACGACELIWDKVSPTMGDLDHPWARQHEPIQFAMRGDSKRDSENGRGGKLARMRSGSVLSHQRQNGSGAKYHVADKPVSLLRVLIEMSTRHGDTVIDPMCGSGATLVAALIEGRQAVGIELETRWADVAAERLRVLTRDGNPFAFDALGNSR